MKAPPLSLRARALGWLAQREHSRLELRRKLLRVEQRQQALSTLSAATDAGDGDVDPDRVAAEVDALLDELTAAGYLSESRFIESRVHARAGRMGAQRIRHELAQHGLALDAEQQAALSASELDRARQVWRKRFGGRSPADAKEWARQSRFLAARGFGAEVVRQLLRAADTDADAAD